MKIDLTTPIFDFDGVTPMKKPATIIGRLDSGQMVELSSEANITLEDGTKTKAGHGQENLDLAHVLMETCRGVLEEDKTEDANEKFWRFELGQKIFRNQKGSLELPVEDWTKLQQRVAKVYTGSIIYGNVYAILNGKNNTAKADSDDGESVTEKTAEVED